MAAVSVMENPATSSLFEGENVISLETYRRNGEPVRTPVLFLEEEGVLFVHTRGRTGKVKRIMRNPKVRIAPSNFRGEPKADYVDARAELETTPETVEKYHSRIYKKYGLMGTFAKFVLFDLRFSRIRGIKGNDVIIVIRP